MRNIDPSRMCITVLKIAHDCKNKKCNNCGTKDKVISKTQSLMKDQKESISRLEKKMQAIKK